MCGGIYSVLFCAGLSECRQPMQRENDAQNGHFKYNLCLVWRTNVSFSWLLLSWLSQQVRSPFIRLTLSKGNSRSSTGDRTPSQVQGINIWCSYVLWYSTSLSIALYWEVLILKYNLCVHAVMSCQCTYVIWFKGCFRDATDHPSQRPLLLVLNTHLRLEFRI